MSVRKRIWKTAVGEERQAWLCDYTGQSGKLHVKTFARKKDADAFIAKAKSKPAKAVTRRIAIASRSGMPRTFGSRLVRLAGRASLQRKAKTLVFSI
jgi:hypothetical protein